MIPSDFEGGSRNYNIFGVANIRWKRLNFFKCVLLAHLHVPHLLNFVWIVRCHHRNWLICIYLGRSRALNANGDVVLHDWLFVFIPILLWHRWTHSLSRNGNVSVHNLLTGYHGLIFRELVLLIGTHIYSCSSKSITSWILKCFHLLDWLSSLGISYTRILIQNNWLGMWASHSQ